MLPGTFLKTTPCYKIYIQVFLMCFCYQLHFPPVPFFQLPILQLICPRLPLLLSLSYLPYRFTHTAQRSTYPQSPQLTQTINHSDSPSLPVTPVSNHVRLYSSILDTPYQNRDAYDASSNDKPYYVPVTPIVYIPSLLSKQSSSPLSSTRAHTLLPASCLYHCIAPPLTTHPFPSATPTRPYSTTKYSNWHAIFSSPLPSHATAPPTHSLFAIEFSPVSPLSRQALAHTRPSLGFDGSLITVLSSIVLVSVDIYRVLHYSPYKGT
jgi:hypothetical protein